MIGDSISMPGSGYGPGVEEILMKPGVRRRPPRNAAAWFAVWRHRPAAKPDVVFPGAGLQVQHKDATRGPLAAVQHSGGKGSNQAGPTTNGAAALQSTWHAWAERTAVASSLPVPRHHLEPVLRTSRSGRCCGMRAMVKPHPHIALRCGLRQDLVARHTEVGRHHR